MLTAAAHSCVRARWRRSALLLFLIGVPCRPLEAQAPRPPIDSIAAFIDSAAAAQMKERGIPGAAVAVVQDGRIVLERGYGFADLGTRRTVEPGRTLFRLASISKPFVAMAVLQLAERGALDLRADVARYAPDIPLHHSGWRGITAADLLTHTAGVDDRVMQVSTASADRVEPLALHLASRFPARVLPPGDVQSYSNYGYALLGLVVERRAGIPFAEYMDRNILGPLLMQHTTFAQPPAGVGSGDIARAYVWNGRGAVPLRPVYTQLAPAGGASGTAHDMGRFMLALLDGGEVDGQRVLQPVSVQRMLTAQYTPDPAVWGLTYGLSQYHAHYVPAVIKDGNLGGFSSMMALFPDQHLGLFYVTNAPAGLDLLGPFAARFLTAGYAPTPVRPVRVDLRRFAGVYRSNRFPRSEVTKASALRLNFSVWARADGTLGRRGTQWVPVDSLRFRRTDSDEEMAFRVDARGRVTQLLAWNGAFDRIPWYETFAAQASMAGGFVVVFAAAPIILLVRRLLRRRRRSGAPPPARSVGRLIGATSLLNLLFLVWFAVAFATVGGQQLLDLPKWILVLLCVPLISLVTTLLLLVATTRALAARQLAGAARAGAVCYAAIACVFLLWLQHWNLIGFHV